MNQSTAITVSQAQSPSGEILETMARLPKRNEDECATSLKNVVTSSFANASQCLWSIPVGRDKNSGRQKFKSGESIRFAEFAKNQFGMLVTMGLSVVRDETPNMESVTVSLIEWDLSKLNNEPGMATVRVYGGRWDIAEQAAFSKARRNAILALLKPYTQALIPDIQKVIVAHYGGNTKEAFAVIAAEFDSAWNVPISELREVVSGEKTSEDKVCMALAMKNYIEDNGDKGFMDVFGREPIKAPVVTDKAHGTKGPGQSAKSKQGQGLAAQTAKQRFNTLQANATLVIGDTEVDSLLKFAVKKTGIAITNWAEKDYDIAAGILANALEAKDGENHGE